MYEQKLSIFAVKSNDQQQYNNIIEASMVSTPEVFTDNSPMSPRPSTTVKKPSARKSLRKFTGILNVKHETAVCRFGSAELERKDIISINISFFSIPKRSGHTKINDQVKRSS